MARQRTGTLEYREGKGWFLRVTVDVIKDGKPTTERRWIDLETHDERRAERMKKKIVAQLAAGHVVAEVRQDARHSVETFAEFTDRVLDERRALGVRQVPSEAINFKKHINPVIGPMELPAIARADVQRVLDTVATKVETEGPRAGLRLSRETVQKIRRQLVLYFNAAVDKDLLSVNPALRAKVPPMQDIAKDRSILADGEIGALLGMPDPDAEHLEIKMLSLVARTEGGAATVQLVRWDWTMVDLEAFAVCKLPHRKKKAARALAIPELIRPFLRAWWERQGSPSSGPVFPVTRGKRKGEQRRESGVSFAKRLRHALLLAGVKRHVCTRPHDADPPRRGEACCPAYAHDPLYATTSTSRPVDFHSFRRAFNTALAEADVNAQKAMHLAGHSDPKVHMRYVQRTASMMEVPAAALPRINAAIALQLARPVDNSSDRPSNPRDFERETGLEPATLSLGSRRPKADRAELLGRDALSTDAADAERGAGFLGWDGDTSTVGNSTDLDGSTTEAPSASPVDPRLIATIDGRPVHPFFAVFATLAGGAS